MRFYLLRGDSSAIVYDYRQLPLDILPMKKVIITDMNLRNKTLAIDSIC